MVLHEASLLRDSLLSLQEEGKVKNIQLRDITAEVMLLRGTQATIEGLTKENQVISRNLSRMNEELLRMKVERETQEATVCRLVEESSSPGLAHFLTFLSGAVVMMTLLLVAGFLRNWITRVNSSHYHVGEEDDSETEAM